MARSLRRQLSRMHAASSACHWCRRATKLLSVEELQRLWRKPLPPDMATIDHLYSRFTSERYGQKPGTSSHVLACRGCNLQRSREELKNNVDVQRYKSAMGSASTFG